MLNSHPTLFRGWRAVLALVVAACAAPERASAACGDHVTIVNEPAGASHDGAPAADRPARLPAPCHGPNCSDAPEPDSSPQPPAPPTGPQAKHVMFGSAPAPVGEPQSGSFPHDLPSQWPVNRPVPIFHPPRLG